MANTTIKTRILLRNDTLANWINSDLVLAKGEVAIATVGENLAEARIGTGSSTWANALKLNVNADQISGLVDTIRGTSKQYQVVANGEGGNSWKLQEAALSGGSWTDVTGSSWTVDFSGITSQINTISTLIEGQVEYLSAEISSTQNTLNTVSSDYVKASDFATISVDIGLDAASSSNKVVTLSDIADLAGAMHFRGAVTPTEGQSDADAIAAAITDPAAGDIVIITTNSKEYVYTGTAWLELGDEAIYATKADVATISAGLTADVNYLSGVVDDTRSTLATVSADYLTSTDKTELESLVATVSAETLTSANAYTDGAIDALSVDRFALSTDVENYVASEIGKLDVSASENGNADSGFVTVVTEADGKVSVTKKTVQLSDITDYEATISSYALSADVDSLVAQVSVDTAVSAYNAATDYVDDILNGFLVLDCGSSTLRTDEPTPPFTA